MDAPAAHYGDDEKLKAIKREIGWRKRVYKARVEMGHMTQKESDYQVKIFEQIAEDYEAKIGKLI